MSVVPEDLVWRVSSWSAGGNCIEVANNKTVIFVRDTEKPRSRSTVIPACGLV